MATRIHTKRATGRFAVSFHKIFIIYPPPLHKTKFLLHFTLVVIFVCCFTQVCWYTSQIMADVFTAVMILTTFLFLFDESKVVKGASAVLLLWCLMMHHSHIFILVSTSVIIIVYSLVKRKNHWKPASALLAMSIVASLWSMSLHYRAGHGFTMSKHSHVFLMGKFCENGMLQTYLSRACKEKDYEICQYRHELPDRAFQFVWDEQSPVFKMGGKNATGEEYDRIINDIVTTPDLLFLLLFKSIVHTGRQLTQIQVGDGLYSLGKKSNPFWKTQAYFPHEVPEFLTSLQQQGTLMDGPFNLIYTFYLLLTSLVVFVLGGLDLIPPRYVRAYTLFLLMILLNAAITANLGNVLARLQSRVVWLIPLLNTALIVEYGLAYLWRKKPVDALK